MNRVFIGWDSREALAYDVCRHSIEAHASDGVMIRPLKERALRAMGVYWRPADPLASTEFTYTRFLVPALANYEGWALFADCDILFRADVGELFDLADDRFAAMVVKHDHRPAATRKMAGQAQTSYPRKNWSSVILWNCRHPANRILSPEIVNHQTGAFLHRFQWLEDAQIGALPLGWNYLIGWNTREQCPEPKAAHFTEGIPGIHPGHDSDEYAGEWFRAVSQLMPGAA